jgi:hypothetical protein
MRHFEFSKYIAFVIHIDVLSRYIVKTIYLEKPKFYSEGIIKQYIILISPKILAHAKAQVNRLVIY